MNGLRKLAESGTFAATLVLCVLWIVADKQGVYLPYEFIMYGIGGFALKEAAFKLRKQ